jgi:hypothetical protein
MAENSLLLEGDPAAIASVTVAIREWVAIEPSLSDNPEGRMHAADTAGLFSHSTSSAWELKDNEIRATM